MSTDGEDPKVDARYSRKKAMIVFRAEGGVGGNRERSDLVPLTV